MPIPANVWPSASVATPDSGPLPRRCRRLCCERGTRSSNRSRRKCRDVRRGRNRQSRCPVPWPACPGPACALLGEGPIPIVAINEHGDGLKHVGVTIAAVVGRAAPHIVPVPLTYRNTTRSRLPSPYRSTQAAEVDQPDPATPAFSVTSVKVPLPLL